MKKNSLPNTPKTSLVDKFLAKINLVSVKRYSRIENELQRNQVKLEQVVQQAKNQLHKQKASYTEQLQQYKEEKDQIICVDGRYGFNIFEVIEKEKSTSEKQMPIVPPQRLPISEELICSFKERISEINVWERSKPKDQQNIINFSKKQEAMIFSDNRATCVLAGAGSGKSTALILRVVFFREYLQIPFDQITICTFTRESRKDFIEKLQLRFQQWGREVLDYQAKSIVRTFHSLAYQMHLKLGDLSKKMLFDFDSQKPRNDDSEGVDIENGMEPNASPPHETPKSERMQAALYKSLYTENDDFRLLVKRLYVNFLRESIRNKNLKFVRNYNISFEDDFSRKCRNTWLKKHPVVELILARFSTSGKENVGGLMLNYHLYLPNLEAKVFLNCTWREFGGEAIEPCGKLLKYIATDREGLCVSRASNSYLLVQNIEELNTLVKLEDIDAGRIKPTDPEMPDFPFACQGDFISKNKNKSLIYKQITQIIDFSYAIGVPLYALSDKQMEQIVIKCSAADRYFIKLARIFHREWIDKLDSENLTTFDDVFYQLGNREYSACRDNDIFHFNKINHLMIDEFQDISPNFIQFIEQLKKHLVSIQISKDGSITCVGDDYQSIYGWRGSSAHFIINFEGCFSFSHQVKMEKLTENYRSAAPILEAGELVTNKFNVSSEKGYEVNVYKEKGPDVTCWFYDGVEVETKVRTQSIDFKLAVKVLETEIQRFKPTENNPIYLLMTTKTLLNVPGSSDFLRLVAKYEKSKQLKKLTIHSSKGLEADCVIVIGDIRLPDEHPVREGLYREANMPGTYQAMQKDEAYRVAYVGITRAKTALHWFFKSSAPDRNLVHFLLREQKFSHRKEVTLAGNHSNEELPA